jgi:CheY-like chemotaxis protein
MGLVLRKKGWYTVLEARTTPEAVTYSRRYQIDLAVIDASMRDAYPGGRAVARELAKISPHLRFLFVSGYPQNLLVEKAVLQPDDPFLAKPFKPLALLERVQELLASPVSHSAVAAGS